jgi:hypothetical protein
VEIGNKAKFWKVIFHKHKKNRLTNKKAPQKGHWAIPERISSFECWPTAQLTKPKQQVYQSIHNKMDDVAAMSRLARMGR